MDSTTTDGGRVRRGGRPRKGARKMLAVRAPIDLADQIIQAAADSGYCMSDYVTMCMARLHGYDLPTPPRTASHTGEIQEELPISA